ncbi:MAG: 2-isopropylmalate synthase [Acidobacteriia bacterium]|nr:2-isopropylmalate synthase [Terriglobia bacterium]
MNSERVLIFDTTLRDGEQSPGCSMNGQEKLRLGTQLEKLGVDILEAGFPVASDGEFEAVTLLATRLRNTRIAALCRCSREDVARTWEALRPGARPRIHIVLSTSDIHLAAKLKITREAALSQAREVVAFARSLCNDVEFSTEDATRSDRTFLCSVLQAAVDSGAATLNICDTVGYTTPSEYSELLKTIRQQVRGVEKATLSAHCHNDLGLAVANTLAGVEAGARQVECTINGIGERAGNAALEEIVMAMRVRNDRLPYETGIRTEELGPSSRLLAEITGADVQPNKAIVGRNAFAHEAGIHQHGMLSNPLCYEIMTPESVGASGHGLVLGKHSGRHALAARYRDLGHQLTKPQLNDVYQRFTLLADRKKRIYDQDLLSLLVPERQAVAG